MQTVVKTKQGLVEGLKSQDGKTVIFRGVPYAQPPVGELRFRRPQAKEPWEGVLPCVEFGPRCPQADLTKMGFYAKEFYDDMVPPCNEDCLYLNIWTPESAGPDAGLPVLFWIHGGAFMHGCGSEKEFDGEGFAKKGVILVSINYRVNAFGFSPILSWSRKTQRAFPATTAFWIRSSPCPGCGKTSRPLAATRTRSPWPANPPDA